MQQNVAALASLNPQISTEKIEMILALGHLSSVFEIEALSLEIDDYEKEHKRWKSGQAGDTKPKPNPVRPGRYSWSVGDPPMVRLGAICNSSPSASIIGGWLQDLPLIRL
jgi:hypothetical protein